MADFSEKDRNVIINLISIAYDKFYKGILNSRKVKHHVSNAIVMEIIGRFVKDKEIIEEYHKGGIRGIDKYKVIGILSYWIARLKPIIIETEYPDPVAKYANEYMALAIVQSLYYERYGKLPVLSQNLIENLRYSLRYRLLNGRTLSLIYEFFVNGYSQGYRDKEKEKQN